VCTNGSGVVNAQVFTGPGGNTTGYTFAWTPNGAATQLATVSPTQDTYYTVVVTSPYGCSNTDSVQVTIDPTQTSPSISLAASATALCNNNLQPIDLVATTDASNPSFQWTPNFINQNSPTVTINPQNSVNVTCTITDQNGCTTATGVSIQVLAPPTANATWVSSPNNVIDFTNSSLNASSYTWIFGDGLTSSELNPSHTYPSAGTWNVTLIANNAGCSDTISFDVVSSIASINKLALDAILAPNPVQNSLSITTTSQVHARILDLTGKEVLAPFAVDGKITIDLSQLRPGIYLVEFTKENAQYTQRILKQ
jgi:hypothetical protein